MPREDPYAIAATVAVEFVNTVACPACHGSDLLATSRRAATWLRKHTGHSLEILSGTEVARVRRFRTTVTDLVETARRGVRPSRRSLARLNGASRRLSTFVEVSWSGGVWRPAHRARPRRGPDLALARIARATIALLGGPELARLRRCEGRGCQHYLLARTRGQRWCSSAGCGNRARVARHYRARSRRRPGRRGVTSTA
ncbi:MAG: CGNR zinc finger domain-containing protein [Thermoplasmata archaeon]